MKLLLTIIYVLCFQLLEAQEVNVIVKDGNDAYKKGDYKNDVVFYITNEYDMPVPFFAAPIGGVPRYKYKIKINSSAKVREK